VSPPLDPGQLRRRYDDQLRAWLPAHGWGAKSMTRDGPLIRMAGLAGGRGFIIYRDLAGLAGPALDELIVRQRQFFADRGEAVEWKLHGHDVPADLPERLRAAGFEPEDEETVVIGPALPWAQLDLVDDPLVRLRQVTARADLDRIASMHGRVYGGDHSYLADSLAQELAADPTGTEVFVAQTTDGQIVCAGWVRFVAGTDFATLWGGSTHPDWRRRGLYRAVVAHRARSAVAKGYQLLQVDASSQSRPILAALGFVEVTTTTPYVWRPVG
jgi:ribosomal protein S18 acetylase RimI-like enzyme